MKNRLIQLVEDQAVKPEGAEFDIGDQVDVHQGDIRGEPLDQLAALAGGPARAHDVPALAVQQQPETLAKGIVILDQNETARHGFATSPPMPIRAARTVPLGARSSATAADARAKSNEVRSRTLR